jgi:hypothetical protein
MAIQVQDIVAIQGEDFSDYWVLATQDPSPIPSLANQVYFNFTGYSMRMQIRQLEDPTSMLLLSLGLGTGLTFASLVGENGPPAPAFNNTVVITLTKAQTLALPAGEWFYDLFLDAPGGTSLEFLAGRFIVQASVTR